MNIVDSCPACCSDAASDIAMLDDSRREMYLKFSRVKFGGLLDSWLREFEPVVRMCHSCGHCWYRYQPDTLQLSEMYGAGIPLGGSSEVSREPAPYMITEMSRLRQLLSSRDSKPCFLDYGSGFGRWAKAATIAGFEVTAFEPSAKRGACTNTPYELVHDVSALEGRKYAAIQLEQVLEHVPNPKETLFQIQGMCDADTVLRVTVPNLKRSPEGGDIWEKWPYDGESAHTLAPYEHLHGFTPRSLDALIAKSGYRSIYTLRMFNKYPLNFFRFYAGKLVPTLGSTLRFLKVAG